MKILHLDSNHPTLLKQLNAAGFQNHEDYTSSKAEIEKKIHNYEGIIIRSRFSIDKHFLEQATRLKFIGRVGAGLENIDSDFASSKGIELIAAPEGNRNAVGEHALGMLLSLFNKLNKADKEVKSGYWFREENRGYEIDGKTIGLYGYGNTGKAFAKKLSGFDVTVLCYDIIDGLGDENASQVSLRELKEKSDVLSLHVPETKITTGLINTAFINEFKKPFWIINTARGKNIITKDLVKALELKKVLGVGLDVLEYEKSSFENFFNPHHLPKEYEYLIKSENTILSPHVAGWTYESNLKLAQTIVNKIVNKFS